MAPGTAQRRSVGAAGADGNTVDADGDLLGWIVPELEEMVPQARSCRRLTTRLHPRKPVVHELFKNNPASRLLLPQLGTTPR